MNRVALVLLLVCVSAVLMPSDVNAFFKAGRELREREAARQYGNEPQYGAADDRELWQALMNARNSQQKRNVANKQ